MDNYAKEKTEVDQIDPEYAAKLLDKYFILYLIPGLPKDIFNYAVGLSEMNFKAFLILSTIGRIPGMTGSLAVGFLLVKKSYTALIILCTCVIICAIFAFIFRKKLKGWLDRFYERIKE